MIIKKYKKKVTKLLNEESGIKFKKKTYTKIKIVLIYPNSYHIGMSNLGFQTIYKLANEIEYVLCERAFLSDIHTSKPIKTIETQTSIKKFDIIAFSISFEMDILGIIDIIRTSKIPIFSYQRNDNYPLIIAGGSLCFLNPEPLSPFIDCFLIGETEKTIKKLLDELILIKNKRKNLIKIANKISSLYIPSLFKTKYNSFGTIKNFKPIKKIPNIIKKDITKNINEIPINSAIITPNTIFKNTFLIETSRGCNHGCRFCSTGYTYSPQRIQSIKTIKKQIINGSKLTNKIGLVGTVTFDYSYIENIKNEINTNLNFMLSSIRIDKITNRTIKFLRKNNIKTATIAPDAGSERLRRVIKKGITEEQILNAIKNLTLGGILNIKIYFIIGLPTENYNDICSMINLCKKIKNCFLDFNPKKKIGNITISLNPFIPKPSTPFQWSAMEKTKKIKKKIIFIKKELSNIPNMQIKSKSTRMAYIQALISRGDRKISKLLLSAYKNNYNWPKTLKTSEIDSKFYVERKRNLDEIFPWDFIKQKTTKKQLLKEYEIAINPNTFFI